MSCVVLLKRVDDEQFHDSHSPDLILSHHGLTAHCDPNTLQMVYILYYVVVFLGGGGDSK